MHKYRLFAPGPTPVPDGVRLAMAAPVLHHRTEAFEEIFAEVRQGLQWVFQTQQEVLCLSGTGTAAMDGAVCNFLSPGDTAVFVNGGKFGERWGEILRAHGVHAVEVSVAWGDAVKPEAVQEALVAHPNTRAVFVQGCETSTGVQHPVVDVASLCAARPECLCVVDGITQVGVSDLALDRDGIDVLISGSQKAFMLPPGLAFVAISHKAWQANKRARCARFYLDFAQEMAVAKKNQSAWTSSVTLVVGLQHALRLMRQEGLDTLFARHARMAAACRKGAQALGCTLFAQAPAAGVTSLKPPPGIEAPKVVQFLAEHYNMTVAGGQDAFKNKIFRVAHMGHFDDLDMLTLLSAIEGCFATLGGRPPDGAGVGAALRSILQA